MNYFFNFNIAKIDNRNKIIKRLKKSIDSKNKDKSKDLSKKIEENIEDIKKLEVIA